MSLKSNNLFDAAVIMIIISGITFASSGVFAFNGPHILAPNPCDVCHIPHHAADDMLWARAAEGPFPGVKRLCASCHGTGLYGAKDRYGIFEPEGGVTFDHVMGEDASINGPSLTRDNWSPFPLKTKEGGDGFYCGSCHDPHRNPYESIDDQGGGDYLREETVGFIKSISDKETAFCVQCHKGIVRGDAKGHGDKHGCFDCHHPHESPNPGTEILIAPLSEFTAAPNVPGFTDTKETAAACYGCHKEGSGFDGAVGAPLAGDDLPVPREHHPMGLGADASTSGHQPTQGGPLAQSDELYCGSCHTVHDGTNAKYINTSVIIRFDPANSGEFCIACHSNKTIEDLGTRGKDHHQVSPFNQCMFCHSIHNAPNDPDALYQTDEDDASPENSSASVDVIMRVPPTNLAWADKSLDTDSRDYEDACYGCHSTQEIAGKEFSLNEENALLFDNVRDNFYSHRFNAIPSPAIKLLNTFEDRLPIISDGKEAKTLNDYNVEEGRIWCGSCHNVHRQNRFTSGIPVDYAQRRSAYLRAENYGSSFCYKCHTAYQEGMGVVNHPQDKSLESGIPMLYYQGYSGGIGGLTNGIAAFDTERGEVVCQTCHSAHTAQTNWDDIINGRLLVRPLDNGFCQDCHIGDPHNPESSASESIEANCLGCHSTHKGQYKGILRYTYAPKAFTAMPNVPAESTDPNHVESSFCYGCHNPFAAQDWLEAGALPIFGDDTDSPREHHPMGIEATKNSPRAKEPPNAYYDKFGQTTCKSCHHGTHGHGPFTGNEQLAKQNYYLRWRLNDESNKDLIDFCIACHDNKGTLKTSPPDNKHYWTGGSSPVKDKRGGCMFCHFTHDGEERQTSLIDGIGIRPDVDALIRVAPKELLWGNRVRDANRVYYEDICYGCHGDKDIVGEGCDKGSLLKWDVTDTYIHTHRFATPPDPNNPPARVIIAGGEFPLSDGDEEGEEKTNNDYGSEPGAIFCGTCHRVHDTAAHPYLNYEQGEPKSPYDSGEFGFCEHCHDAESARFKFVHKSHPIGKGPNPPATENKWEEIYCSGGSGCRGGITYPQSETGNMICLTCHNVHAAATDWKGDISSDSDSGIHGKLLIRDNKSAGSEQGSDLCRDCHNFNN
ncbi:hypothetical protein JXL19_13250 [bacterium]|nr:hypothetical protein [bacterium]